MEGQGEGRTGWRRLSWWHWVVVIGVIVAVSALTLALIRPDRGDARMDACRAIVEEVRLAGMTRRSVADLLAVVQRQEPIAESEAERDPGFRPVADAIRQMRLDLEAGRPWPTVVVLYDYCGDP